MEKTTLNLGTKWGHGDYLGTYLIFKLNLGTKWGLWGYTHPTIYLSIYVLLWIYYGLKLNILKFLKLNLVGMCIHNKSPKGR